MKPVEPHQQPGGRRVVFAADQPQYDPLPAVIDSEGVIHTRWQLSADERRAVLDGSCLELMVWTFGQALQPVYLRIEGVEEPVVSESEAPT